MPELMLTEEQARILTAAQGAVVVRIPTGEAVGVLDPAEQAVIAEAKRRLASNAPRIPAERVQAHMAALQAEWERTGGFDREYMTAFLQRLREADAA